MQAFATDFSSQLTLKEALPIFFERSHLPPDGGINDNWIKLKFGNFYIPFPNTASRKKAVTFHDVHHILTGYASNWKGEAEIGAWEVSSGCGSYTAAWVLDMGVFAMGLYLFPKAVFKAFVRGRRTSNFYHYTHTYQQLLQMDIGAARSVLKLDIADNTPATGSEVLAFIGWWLLSGIISFMLFLAPLVLIAYLIFR